MSDVAALPVDAARKRISRRAERAIQQDGRGGGAPTRQERNRETATGPRTDGTRQRRRLASATKDGDVTRQPARRLASLLIVLLVAG